MKIHIVLLLLLAISLSQCKTAANSPQQTEPTPVSENGQLHIEGPNIVNAKGEKMQLRGMSLYWSQWQGQYYNREVVKWLKDDWQCNVVRAAMAVEHDGYLTKPDLEKAKIKAVIEAAIQEGIYVIIDWHDHHAEQHQAAATTFFSEIAAEYGSYPNLIYEPYNEPLDVSWQSVLKPYHEAVIAAIRQHDPNNIVVCGTRNWSQKVEEVIGHRIDDPNVAYTLHYYAASHKKDLREPAIEAIEAGIPLFVTEYGTTHYSGDKVIDPVESKIWWEFLDKHSISHCNWSITDKEELSAAIRPNANPRGQWTTAEISESGKLVRAEIKAKNKQY